MNKTTRTNNDFVTVIPYNPDPASLPAQKIVTHTLCFWDQDEYAHKVSPQNVDKFLKKVKLFGATIYPDKPMSGCFAWESELRTSDGELPVLQIIYNDEIVYSMNETRTKCIIAANSYRIK